MSRPQVDGFVREEILPPAWRCQEAPGVQTAVWGVVMQQGHGDHFMKGHPGSGFAFCNFSNFVVT